MDKLSGTWQKLSLDYDQFWASSFYAQGKSAHQIVRDLEY